MGRSCLLPGSLRLAKVHAGDHEPEDRSMGPKQQQLRWIREVCVLELDGFRV